MIVLIISYCLIQIFTLFCSGKDAASFLLKDQSVATSLTYKRIKRWHRDGGIIWSLFVAVLTWANVPYSPHALWYVPVLAVLIRLGSYDLGFNKWAQLPIDFLGSTAWWDKLFIAVFGNHGAIKKSIAFTIIQFVVIYFLRNKV